MKRFARVLVVILSLAVIGSVVSLVPQKNAAAVGGAPVTIMNTATNAVPVTGTVNATVSGTVGVNNFPATQNVNISNPSIPVSAQQSGDWNVGLAGTPTVQFANTTPLLVKNLDEPGREPYQQTVQIPEANSGCPGSPCDSTFTFPAVPANKRLVIQHVSANLILFSGSFPFSATLGPTGPGNPLPLGGHQLLLTLQGSGQGFDFWITSQQVTFYVDPLQQPTIDVTSDPAHTPQSVAINATITGYLVSLP